jgi:phosphomannomutase
MALNLHPKGQRPLHEGQASKRDLMTLHTFNPAIMREYDIRGEVNKTLFEADALALGRKFGITLSQSLKKNVCVGRDGRLTSPTLTSALIEGLLEKGMDVTDLGMGPTPMTYFGLKKLGFDAAIMVTGSHNPAPDNGFKMALQNRPFFGKDIQDIAKIDEMINVGPSGTLLTQNVADQYVERLLQDYEPPVVSIDHPLKIVWDAGNGATGDILKELTKGIAGEHILLNEKIDGTFPAHHPDPTVAENLVQLIESVKAHKADVGIAFDGDGDRIGVVDGTGRIIWGDQLLLLLARDVVRQNPGATIIADVKSTQALFDEITKLGGNILMARTGHSLIKSKMAETGALLAGEMSGHIFYADKYYGYDDALYSAVRLINILQQSPQSLNQMIESLPHFYNTPEIRIDCADDKKFNVVDTISQKLASEKATVSTIDGVRVSREHGWWLLRASNTQATLVARCESATQTGLEALQMDLAGYLEPHGLKV